MKEGKSRFTTWIFETIYKMDYVFSITGYEGYKFPTLFAPASIKLLYIFGLFEFWYLQDNDITDSKGLIVIVSGAIFLEILFYIAFSIFSEESKLALQKVAEFKGVKNKLVSCQL